MDFIRITFLISGCHWFFTPSHPSSPICLQRTPIHYNKPICQGFYFVFSKLFILHYFSLKVLTTMDSEYNEPQKITPKSVCYIKNSLLCQNDFQESFLKQNPRRIFAMMGVCFKISRRFSFSKTFYVFFRNILHIFLNYNFSHTVLVFFM